MWVRLRVSACVLGAGVLQVPLPRSGGARGGRALTPGATAVALKSSVLERKDLRATVVRSQLKQVTGRNNDHASACSQIAIRIANDPAIWHHPTLENSEH